MIDIKFSSLQTSGQIIKINERKIRFYLYKLMYFIMYTKAFNHCSCGVVGERATKKACKVLDFITDISSTHKRRRNHAL